VDRNTRSASFTPRERACIERAPVARLATVRPDGRPHLVPVTFALAAEDLIVTAVDHKPKRSTDLQRLRNVGTNPEVSLLVDHYDDDWEALWWLRVDATARVVLEEPSRSTLARPLVRKYEAYVERPPAGPVLAMAVHTVVSWNLGSGGP
jgi:PPOX class probable F420-dependent enzyme